MTAVNAIAFRSNIVVCNQAIVLDLICVANQHDHCEQFLRRLSTIARFFSIRTIFESSPSSASGSFLKAKKYAHQSRNSVKEMTREKSWKCSHGGLQDFGV
jgi:hypothetical protein